MSENSDIGNLLRGMLVVELGGRDATAACGGLLARLGATVVHCGEPAAAEFMAGKAHLAVAPAEELSELVAAAGIVLLSTDRSDEARRIWDAPRPEDQILCDLTAFGHSGPLAGKGMPESFVQALGGIAETTGPRAGLPTLIGFGALDMEAAVYAAGGILAALLVKERTGQGQRIEVALYDVAVNALLTFIPLHWTGREATRSGNRHPATVPWNSFDTRDGRVLICGPTNAQWAKICEAMGRPELAADPRFAMPAARLENVAEVDAQIAAWTATQTTEGCLNALSLRGVPCSDIVDLADLPSEPNLVHRGMICRWGEAPGGPIWVPGMPIRAAGPTVFNLEARAVPKTPQPSSRPRVTGDPRIARDALAGLRIIEVGMNTVAPLATRQLGALGAEVIKVEPPSGDVNRINAPLREDGESYIFALSNTDKTGIVLDLKQPEAKARLRELIASADVMIENLKPGSLDRLGFGAREVLQANPRIIYCSVNGFGHDSRYPGRPALDSVIQAMSGAMSATLVEGVPTKAGISISDQLGGQFGLFGILAGLLLREQTGSGIGLDIAMQDCSAWATQTAWNGIRPPQPLVMPVADGAVVAESVKSVPDTGMGRDEAVKALAEAGIAAVPVCTVGEVLAAEQTRVRRLLVEVPTPDGSSWMVLASPIGLRGTSPRIRAAMARLGWENRENGATAIPQPAVEDV